MKDLAIRDSWLNVFLEENQFVERGMVKWPKQIFGRNITRVGGNDGELNSLKRPTQTNLSSPSGALFLLPLLGGMSPAPRWGRSGATHNTTKTLT